MYSPISAGALRHFLRGYGGGDRAAAWVAERQLGLITAWQLEAIGIGRGPLAARRARQLLHPMHRGVYLVGHATLAPGARELAAVLACGGQAYVSHMSAAVLWTLISAESATVAVTVPGRNCRSRAGIVVHKTRELHPRDRTTRQGIPITAPARTLIDFASVAGGEEAERATAEAFALKLVTERQILAAIDRTPHRVGVAVMRAILAQPGGPSRTRSGAEQSMLRLIRAARLPVPRANYPVAGFTADFCWPDALLIVEIDGYDFHSSRASIERDHRRDVVHRDAGYEVLRFTARQLKEAPLYVAAVITRALDRRSRSRTRG